MFRDKRHSNVFIAIVLFLTTALAVTNTYAYDAHPIADTERLDTNVSSLATLGIETQNMPYSGLVRLGEDIQRSSLYKDNDSAVQASGSDVLSLPPIPRTLLMVLFGFMCVTLVRDKKIWLAVFSTLISPGYLSQALPSLAQHMSHVKEFRAENSLKSFVVEESSRTRCDIEGTGYIGLLHYLEGIPARQYVSPISDFLKYHQLPSTGRNFLLRLDSDNDDTVKVQPDAVISIFSLHISLPSCSDRISEQREIFKPAFIFSNLARGPPVFS